MKKILRYISEIVFSLVLIFCSYFAWDRVDVEAYEKYITQYTSDDVAINLDDEFSKLAFVSDKETINPSILSVNNYQNKEYNVNIFLELNGVNEEIINNLVLVIDNESYNLRELYKSNDGCKYYFLITKVDLLEYEKKDYSLKLLVEDNYEFNSNLKFSYSILEEIV